MDAGGILPPLLSAVPICSPDLLYNSEWCKKPISGPLGQNGVYQTASSSVHGRGPRSVARCIFEICQDQASP